MESRVLTPMPAKQDLVPVLIVVLDSPQSGL